MPERDFLDEIIQERTAENPEFPEMVEAAGRRRALLQAIAERRKEHKRSQTVVAAKMHSSQSSVARLEASATDALVSTLERYAQAVGFRIQYHLIPEESTSSDPPVVVHQAPSAAPRALRP